MLCIVHTFFCGGFPLEGDKYVGRNGAVVCSHGNLGIDINKDRSMGFTECVYPTLLKLNSHCELDTE